MEFNDPKEIDDPQVFDDPKEISVYGLWFSKLYGATSINDGLDVIFFAFCLSFPLSIVADNQRVCF